MSTERPRIPPLEPPYLPEAAAELGRWMGRGAALEPLKLFRTLVRHLPLAEAMLPLGRYLLSRRLSVDLHEREVVIDRVCARCGSEYEWGVHASVYGQAAGLSDAQLRATVMGGSHDPAWNDRERLLVRLVDELHDTAHVSEDLWSHLASERSAEQLLDLLVLAGWYHVICYVTNGALVQHEDWQARFPASESLPT